ncbi:MAG: Glu/Leu/Phe/Val dehydrogenase dimerization domain-containing protein [Bacteroidota bacterium]
MLELLKKFEEKRPEIVFEWKDQETEAEGWVVINSLRGGAAGGGTRMRKGLDKREVESLAKTMEIKFTVSGPAIGGAKSGINFDPFDPRKPQVLRRWYKAVLPLLKHYYGTGGDLFVDEIHEVIPITHDFGLLHPQEGVVNGHFKGGDRDKHQRITNLQQGVSKKVEDVNFLPEGSQHLRVADLITGYGVAMSVIHYYAMHGISLSDKRVLVQGWGNVGAAAGFYLTAAGAQVTGILDKDSGIYRKAGFTKEETNRLINTRQTALFEGFSDAVMKAEEIWDQQFDIFIPAASSRLVTQQQVEKLVKNGVEMISCGANVPFADQEIFFGPIARYADERITLIPDFISNCGMARVFAYLMSNPDDLSDKGIFNDVSDVIHQALKNIYAINKSKTNITKSAFEIALKQLV